MSISNNTHFQDSLLRYVTLMKANQLNNYHNFFSKNYPHSFNNNLHPLLSYTSSVNDDLCGDAPNQNAEGNTTYQKKLMICLKDLSRIRENQPLASNEYAVKDKHSEQNKSSQDELIDSKKRNALDFNDNENKKQMISPNMWKKSNAFDEPTRHKTHDDEKKDVSYNNENDDTTRKKIERLSNIDKQVINLNDKVMPADGFEADKSLLDLTISKKHVNLLEKSKKGKEDKKQSTINDQVFSKNCQKNQIASVEPHTRSESRIKSPQSKNQNHEGTLNSKTFNNFDHENRTKTAYNFVNVDRNDESSIAIEQVNHQNRNDKKSPIKINSNPKLYKKNKEPDRLRNGVNNKENYCDENKFNKLKIKVENEELEEPVQDVSLEKKEALPKDVVPPVPQLAKLKKFLNTLQQFADDLNSDIGLSVKILIQELLNSAISVEEFHEKMQKSTNFPLRPFAIPFLKTNLPLLQEELGLFQPIQKTRESPPIQTATSDFETKKHISPKNSTEKHPKPHNLTPSLNYQPENFSSLSNPHNQSSFQPFSHSNPFFNSNKPFPITSNSSAFSDVPSFIMNFEKFFSKNLFNSPYYTNPYLHYFDDKLSLFTNQHFLDNNVKTDLLRESSPKNNSCPSLLSLKNYGKDSGKEYNENDLSNNSRNQHFSHFKPKRKLHEENTSNNQKKQKITQFNGKTPKTYHHNENAAPMLKNKKPNLMNAKEVNGGCDDQQDLVRRTSFITNNELTEELINIWLRFEQQTAQVENTMAFMMEKCKEQICSLRLNTQRDIEALLMLVNNNCENNHTNKNIKKSVEIGMLHNIDDMSRKSTDALKRHDSKYTTHIQNKEQSRNSIESYKPYLNEKLPKNKKLFEDANSTPTTAFASLDHLEHKHSTKITKQKSHSFDGVYYGSKEERYDESDKKVEKTIKSFSENNLRYETTKDNMSISIRKDNLNLYNTTTKNGQTFEKIAERNSKNNQCWGCGQEALETCGGCNEARYCNVVCQHKHWYLHYSECKRFQDRNNNDTNKKENNYYNKKYFDISNENIYRVKKNQLENEFNSGSLAEKKSETVYRKHTKMSFSTKSNKNIVRNQILNNKLRKKLAFYKMKVKSSKNKLYKNFYSRPSLNGSSRLTKTNNALLQKSEN